jgi:hypothetical protein
MTSKVESYPPPQSGTWTLTAPDGRTWTCKTPLGCVRQENMERVPAQERLRRLKAALRDDIVTFDFPKGWAPYLQAVILGALNDFDSDCRWHLNELQKRLGEYSSETGGNSCA